MTHAESIRLFDRLGVEFIPELKRPEVPMTESFSQADYATRMINEYVRAGIAASRVHPQSFSLDDVRYWIENHPAFAAQAVYLDPRGRDRDFRPTLADMQLLHSIGVTTLAPPIPMLVMLNAQQQIVPTPYARMARKAGLNLVTWTFESGRADDPDNWLYAPLSAVMTNESKMLEVLDVLAKDVGIIGIFSDWPETVTYYANCMSG
jgi:glycerophosphoryl diester phosphodiesterase